MAELSRKVHAAAQKQITHEQLEAIAAEEMGGRWRTRTLAPLLHVPPAGTWGFHGRPELLVLDAWLGVDLPTREEGAKHFVRSYLACVRAGDATGSPPLRRCPRRRPAARSRAAELRTFRDERGRELLDLPRRAAARRRHPAPIRFLPKWDSSLLAYAPPERTRILPEKFRSTVIRKNGDVLPTVLVDGFVAATWNVDKKRGLEIEPLRRLTKAERAEIDEEGERLVEFVRS